MSTVLSPSPNTFAHSSPRVNPSDSPSSCSSSSSPSYDVDGVSDPTGASPASSSTTDDEEGVFFGAHDPREKEFFAQLVQHQPSSSSTPTASPRPIRLRKRDSTEILRRKSLLLSVQKNTGPRRSIGEPKKWEGGFYERQQGVNIDEEDDSDTSSEPSTPVRFHLARDGSPSRPGPVAASDLTLDFSSFVISNPASRSETGAGGALTIARDEEDDDDSSEGSDAGDSDKENTALPVIVPESDSEEEDIGPERLGEVTWGFGLYGSTDSSDLGGLHADSADHLDMGGLHLSDFSDPEHGYEDVVPPEATTDVFLDGLSDGEDEFTSGDVTVRAPLAQVDLSSTEPGSDLLSESDQIEDTIENWEPSQPFQSPAFALDPDHDRNTSPVEGADLLDFPQPGEDTENSEKSNIEQVLIDTTYTSHTASQPFETPSHDPSSSALVSEVFTSGDDRLPSSHSSEPEDGEDESDSPLPIARGGPVIIPQLASHLLTSIRADTGSPFRSLPSGSDPRLNPEFGHAVLNDSSPTIRLAQLDSPVRSTPARTLSIALEPLPTTVSEATPSVARAAPAPAAIRGIKVLKSSIVPGSVDRNTKTSKTTIEASKTTIARALAIREQLGAAIGGPGKLGMGPPKRTISGSSVSSGTSSSSNPQRPPSRAGMPARPVSSSQTSSRSGPSVFSQQRNVSRVPSSTISSSRPALTSSSSRGFSGASTMIATTSGNKPPSKGITKPISRPALAPRSIPAAAAAPTPRINPHRTEVKSMRPPSNMGLPRPASATGASAVRAVPPNVIVSPPPKSASNVGPNPLKRPLSVSQSAQARPLLAVGQPASRPALGMPSRLVRDMTIGHGAPVFSIGVAGEGGYGSTAAAVGRARFGSPRVHGLAKRGLIGSPAGQRPYKLLGTPSRLGTPARRAPPQPGTGGFPAMLSYSTSTATAPSPKPNIFAPVAAATRGATDACEVEAALEEERLPRGSSEDNEDVSFALPLDLQNSSDTSSSPSKPDSKAAPEKDGPGSPTSSSSSSASSGGIEGTRGESRTTQTELAQVPSSSTRPKRVTRPPPQPAIITNSSRTKATPMPSIAPNMSERELKTATERNTMANQVYRYCAIDRQVIHVPGPRPPSPTSKIPKSSDREEEDKKASRSERAKRRSEGEEEDATKEEVGVRVVETIQVSRWQGEDEDYKTPQRATKKTRIGKAVRWDRGLVVIRDDGVIPVSRSASASVSGDEDRDRAEYARRSSIRSATNVQLDQHGNVVTGSRPEEPLKKQRLVVTAVFYEGEEEPPYKPSYLTTGQEAVSGKGGKGKGKKK